jgi:hypothetical protein
VILPIAYIKPQRRIHYIIKRSNNSKENKEKRSFSVPHIVVGLKSGDKGGVR